MSLFKKQGKVQRGGKASQDNGTLPPYSIRISPRSRKVRFKINRKGELVVCVPKGFDVSRIPELIKTHRDWIDEALKGAEDKRNYHNSPDASTLPEEVTLQYIDRTWSIEYSHISTSGYVELSEKNGVIKVCGDVDNERLCRAILRRWLVVTAKKVLSGPLEDFSSRTGLRYNSLSVRIQKTRWGSCSSTGRISLNAKLMFLPKHLVNLILIHELAHTRHPNHSRDFWSLVGEFEPNYREYTNEMKQCWNIIPPWMDADTD